MARFDHQSAKRWAQRGGRREKPKIPGRSEPRKRRGLSELGAPPASLAATPAEPDGWTLQVKTRLEPSKLATFGAYLTIPGLGMSVASYGPLAFPLLPIALFVIYLARRPRIRPTHLSLTSSGITIGSTTWPASSLMGAGWKDDLLILTTTAGDAVPAAEFSVGAAERVWLLEAIKNLIRSQAHRRGTERDVPTELHPLRSETP